MSRRKLKPQAKFVLDLLVQNPKGITNRLGMSLGIGSLSSRISEIRRAGYSITKIFKRVGCKRLNLVYRLGVFKAVAYPKLVYKSFGRLK